MLEVEFENKIKENKINLKNLGIYIGCKSNIPNTFGCYKVNNTWYIYDVNEYQRLVIVKSGIEEDIFNYMYKLVLGKLEL